MKKAPEAFRTISEVAELLETPAHVLRFWESKFYQLRPVKRAGRRRYYRPDDVSLIAGIRELLQVQGLTIRGVQRVLQEKGVRHVVAIGVAVPLPELSPEQRQVIEFAEAAGDAENADVVVAGDRPAGRVERVAPSAAASGDATLAPAPPATEPATEPATVPAVEAAEAEPAPPEPADVIRLPALLRQWPRERLAARERERLAGLARRIDALLDRMSEASGAGRW